MKRFALTVALVLLLVPQVYAAGTWNQSIAAAQKKAKQSKQLIFVDLFASWCGWCHRMEQEVFPSEAFQKQTDDLVLLRLNTEDGGEGTRLAQRFYVTSLPTFLVLTPDLELAGMIRGYLPSQEFAKAVADTKSKFHDFEKRAANEQSIANDYPKRLALAKEFTMHWEFEAGQSRLEKLIADKKAPVDIRDQAYVELAVSQALQSRPDDATRTLGALAKIQSKGEAFERSRILQAQIYYEQGNLKAAASELRSFKTKFPNSPLKTTADAMLPQIEQSLARK